jgi:Putative prokaryotic signal transducing protein
MADDLRERLLASYAHTGEAMVIQNVLEAGGVPCRVADLEHIPTHVLGMAGGLGRSVGLWVLEMDVERATSLLAALRTTDGGVDEEALAAEALAAAPPGRVGPEAQQAVAPARRHPSRDSAAHFPWFVRATVAVVVALAALLALRGCH